MTILAIHRLVDPIVSAEMLMDKECARVDQPTLVLRQIADLNVLSVQNVPWIELVSIRSVLILAPTPVGWALSVPPRTTILFAHVHLASLVIHSPDVHHNVSI